MAVYRTGCIAIMDMVFKREVCGNIYTIVKAIDEKGYRSEK
jgi:hypothetical protein